MNWPNIFAGVLFAGLGALWVYSMIAGRKADGYVSISSEIINALQEAVKGFEKAYPSDTASMILAIFDIASVAAANAEQLFLSGQLGKEERKDAARQYVYAALEAMEIEVDDRIRAIVNGAIEAACLLDIPHL